MQFFYSDEYLSGYYSKGLSIVTVPSVIEKAPAPESVKKNPALAFDSHDQAWPNIPSGVVPEGQNAYMVFSAIIFGVEGNIDRQLLDLNKRYNAAYDKAVADGKTKRIRYPSFNAAAPGKSLSR
jgi:multiple sugar transport system substrate-binding protein